MADGDLSEFASGLDTGGVDYGAGGGSESTIDWTGDVAARQYNPPGWMGAGGAGGGGRDWGADLQGFAKSLGLTEPGGGLKALTAGLGLGSTALNFVNQGKLASQSAEQTRLMKQGQESAQAAAAPAVEFGKEELANARAGKLSAASEAGIEQWVQQKKSEMRARYAHMGLGDSSDIASEDARIDLMAKAMREQLIQQEANLGLAGLNIGAQTGVAGANVAGHQQDFLANLIAGANKQLGLLGGTAA